MNGNFSRASLATSRSRLTLLAQMAKDAEKLAAQAERIKELRRFARVSQETAAGAIGVTLRGYQRWERGEGEIAGENLKKLAGYFGTTPDYVEYGVMQRERGDTPDPFALPTMTREQVDDMVQENRARLERIENRLNEVWDHLALMEAALNTLAGEVLKAGQRSTEPASSTGRPARRRRAA